MLMSSREAKALWKAMDRARAAQKMTHHGWAVAANLKPSVVYRIRKDGEGMGLETAIKLARALGGRIRFSKE